MSAGVEDPEGPGSSPKRGRLKAWMTTKLIRRELALHSRALIYILWGKCNTDCSSITIRYKGFLKFFFFSHLILNRQFWLFTPNVDFKGVIVDHLTTNMFGGVERVWLTFIIGVSKLGKKFSFILFEICPKLPASYIWLWF